jgi:hypothetical protein
VTERDQLRQQRARPVLESIKSQIEVAKGQSLPKSALAKACNYTLTFWPRLTRFLDYPILELSNNAAENSIRPVALGRKNWIHFGSQEAGPRIAEILSIVEACRGLKRPSANISPLSYQASRNCPSAASLNSPQRIGCRKLTNFVQLPFRQPCAPPDGYLRPAFYRKVVAYRTAETLRIVRLRCLRAPPAVSFIAALPFGGR